MRKLTIAMTLFVSLMQAQPGSDSDYWINLSEDQKVVLLQGIYTGVARSLQIMSEETNRQENAILIGHSRSSSKTVLRD